MPLLPDHVDDKLLALELEMLCDGVCDATVLSLFEKLREGGGGPEWLAWQRRKIDGGVAQLAKIVGAGPWTVGDRFSLGDIAVGTATAYLSVRFQEMPWRSMYPDLARFSDQLERRPSFKDTVPYAQKFTDTVV